MGTKLTWGKKNQKDTINHFEPKTAISQVSLVDTGEKWENENGFDLRDSCGNFWEFINLLFQNNF